MPPLQNDKHETFCRVLVGGTPDGDTTPIGNASEAYRRVYDVSTDGSANSGGSRLMSRPEVRARVRELRDELADAAKARARDWWELVPKAQQTLLDAVNGEYAGDPDSGRTRITAAQQILDRAMGTVREMHQLQVDGQAIVVGVAGPPHELEDDEESAGRQVEADSREHADDPFVEWFGDGDQVEELMPAELPGGEG